MCINVYKTLDKLIEKNPIFLELTHIFIENQFKTFTIGKRAGNNPKLNLRVYITGGGCSGFQYGFTFDEEIQEDDIIITQTCSNQNATVKLLVDSLSYQYLENATIDFREGLQEEFVIHNPNAKTTCGCGSSFSIDEGE